MKLTIVALGILVPCAAWCQGPASPPAPAPAAARPTQDAGTERAADAGNAHDALLEGADSVLNSLKPIEDYVAKQDAAEQAATGTPLHLTARRCVEMALSQNAQVSVAQDDLDAARAKIGQARSQMKPQLKGSMTFTHTEFNTRDISSQLGGAGGGMFGGGGPLMSLVQRFMGGGLLGGLGGGMSGGGFSLQGDDDIRTDKVELNQVLYAGGQIRAAINASKYLTESQEWKKEATLAQLEYQAKQAYYDAAASAAFVAVAEASVKSFERNLSDAQQMFDVGMVSNFEVLRAQTELGSRKATLVEARNAQRLAIANLRRIIAVPQDTPIELEPKMDWLPYTPQLDELKAYAQDHRPEIQSLKKGIDAAKSDLVRVQGQYKPRVGANIQWQNVDGGGFAQPDGWTFSVAGQLDIYAGGKRKYDRVESKARIQSLEDQLRDVEALVELDVTQATIQIKDAMARISSESGTVKLAQEGLRLAELRFQEGVGTQSETLDAELALTNAKRSLVQALRDLAVGNASLEKAIGKTWKQEEAAPASTATPAPEPAQPTEKEAAPAAK